MKKRRAWSRRKKTVRNWLLVLLILGIFYIAGGCPPLTKQAVVKEILRENLMEQGEVIWEEINSQGDGQIYIYSGDTVLRTTPNLLQLGYQRGRSVVLYGHGGVTCVPSTQTPGQMLVFGNLPAADTAVLELRMSTGLLREKERIYTAEGVRVSDKVITFALPETYENDAEFFAVTLRNAYYQQGYYNYTLRLYDAAGQELGAWTDVEKQETA